MGGLGLLGATLVTLVVSGAAQFSYDALTNQDYLQFGDVRTPAFGCLTRASCHVSDDAFLFIDKAAVSKPAVRQVLHPARLFAASGQSEYMRRNLVLLQYCMMLSGCRSGRGHLLAKCGYVSNSGDWLQLQTSLFSVSWAVAGHILWAPAGPGCAGSLQPVRELCERHAPALGCRSRCLSGPQPRSI